MFLTYELYWIMVARLLFVFAWFHGIEKKLNQNELSKFKYIFILEHKYYNRRSEKKKIQFKAYQVILTNKILSNL